MALRKKKILHYFFINMVLFLVLVIPLHLYIVRMVYNWGIDDNTYYFMTLRAESATPESMVDDGVFHVYDDYQKIPSRLREYFHDKELLPRELYLKEDELGVVYLLPYQQAGDR